MRISDWSSDVCSSDLRARLADGSHYAVGIGELSETILVRHTIFRLRERYFVMVVRSVAYAGQKDPMRTRDHHQWPVIRRVFRQQDGHGECSHPGHAVFHMPGVEIGMPVEFLALEARFIIEA